MEERFLVPSTLLPENPVASWYDLTYHSPSPNRLTPSSPTHPPLLPFPTPEEITIVVVVVVVIIPSPPFPSPLPQRTRIKNGRATKILSFCATRLLQLAVAPRRIKRVGKPKILQSPTPRSRAFCVFFRRNRQESPSEVRAVLDPGRAP